MGADGCAKDESRYQGPAGHARFAAFVIGDLVATGLRLRRAQIAAAVRGLRGGARLRHATAASTFQQRIAALLVGIFAGVAVLLAAIGIYGVMSYAVSARTQEMGVRLALGAQRGDVLWLVLGQVLRLSAVGLTLGIAILLVAGRLLERLLFEVRASDPLTIGLVTLVLAAVAVVAAWAPASRASRVDPIQALRYE